MIGRVQFSTLALVVLAAAAAAPAQEKTDQERIQGEYRAIDYEDEGGKATQQELQNIVAVFSANELIVEQRQKLNKARFKLDPKQNPKAIDILPTNGVDAGKTLPGIYAFDGDKLKICWGEKGTRPKEFKSGAASGTVVLILQRRKP